MIVPESSQIIDNNGFVEIKRNPISCVGVYDYLGDGLPYPAEPGKMYQVFRAEEELSRPETLDSLRLMPLIDDHTPLGNDGSDASEVGIHGVIGESVEYDNGTIYATIKIHSGEMMDKIESGKRHLSAAYNCERVHQPGNWMGKAYDFIQKNILFNHVALVDQGRMGDLAMVLDRQEIILNSEGKKVEQDKLDRVLSMLETLIAAMSSKAESVVSDEKPDDEVVEDAEEEKEDDDEPEDEKKKGIDMDSAIVASIKKQIALDSAKKSDIYQSVKQFTGVMDAASFEDAEALAVYSLGKVGIKAEKTVAIATLNGYLAASKQPIVADAVEVKSLKIEDFE